MNKVILAGRLARDPEVRYTQTGKAVANFTLAVNKRFSKPADGQSTADFISIVAWEKLAEICGNNLQKGSQVLIEGRIQTRSYDAQDGSKRYVTEVLASDVEFMGARPTGTAEPQQYGGHAQPMQEHQPMNSLGHGVDADEDIPF